MTKIKDYDKIDYFIGKGIIATALSALFLAWFVWGSWGFDFTSNSVGIIIGVFIAIAIFSVIAVFGNYNFKLYKKIENEMTLWLSMTLATFVALEGFTILISILQGWVYYNPALGLFWQYRLVDFIVAGLTNVAIQWWQGREVSHLFR